MLCSRHRVAVRGVIAASLIGSADGSAVYAQIPGLPTPGPQAAGAKELPRKPVAAADGPIKVKENISDRSIQQFLAKFLPKYPGVIDVNVSVDDGVVNLEGRVDDDDSRDEITGVVTRVEGVRVVMNQMKSDEVALDHFGDPGVGGESRPHPERGDLQRDHGQRDGIAQLSQQF